MTEQNYKILSQEEYDKLNHDEKIAYTVLTKDSKALNDKNIYIRRESYRHLGYTKEALNDESLCVRLEAYRHLGYTEEALNDKDMYIRRESYRHLGYTKEALNDKDMDIRREAETYFKIKDKLKKENEMDMDKRLNLGNTNNGDGLDKLVREMNNLRIMKFIKYFADGAILEIENQEEMMAKIKECADKFQNENQTKENEIGRNKEKDS